MALKHELTIADYLYGIAWRTYQAHKKELGFIGKLRAKLRKARTSG